MQVLPLYLLLIWLNHTIEYCNHFKISIITIDIIILCLNKKSTIWIVEVEIMEETERQTRQVKETYLKQNRRNEAK